MNLDNTCNQLQTLSEYIDDTEDYIQFDLDTKRNKLIEVKLRIHRIPSYGLSHDLQTLSR